MRQIRKDSTDVSIDVYIVDASDGTPETGVVFDSAGMDLKYRREGGAVVDITEVTLATLETAHAPGGFLEIGNGVYRLDLPDAAVATGAETVAVFGTATGMIVLPQTIQLVTGAAGTGDTPVNAQIGHDQGENGLRATDGGVGVDNVNIRFYLRTDYDNDIRTVLATAVTDAAGDFVTDVNLDDGLDHVAIYRKPGQFESERVNFLVTA